MGFSNPKSHEFLLSVRVPNFKPYSSFISGCLAMRIFKTDDFWPDLLEDLTTFRNLCQDWLEANKFQYHGIMQHRFWSGVYIEQLIVTCSKRTAARTASIYEHCLYYTHFVYYFYSNNFYIYTKTLYISTYNVFQSQSA